MAPQAAISTQRVQKAIPVDKANIEAHLLALERNAGLRARGLQRRALELDLEGASVQVEAIFAHLAPRDLAGARAEGPPIVLVHGTPGSLFNWGRVALGGPGFQGLAARFEVYLLELIGHGLTRASCPPYGFQRCAAFVAGFIADMGLENVLLAGHAYGGEFAWRAALDRPDLVARLVLVAPSGCKRPELAGTPPQLRTLPGLGLACLLSSRESIRAALQPHFRGPVEEELVSEVYYNLESSENWNALLDLLRDENGAREQELAQLTQPTLLLWGEEDRSYPAEPYAERFHGAIPESQLVLLPACGHHVLESRPAEVAHHIQGFIDATWR